MSERAEQPGTCEVCREQKQVRKYWVPEEVAGLPPGLRKVCDVCLNRVAVQPQERAR